VECAWRDAVSIGESGQLQIPKCYAPRLSSRAIKQTSIKSPEDIRGGQRWNGQRADGKTKSEPFQAVTHRDRSRFPTVGHSGRLRTRVGARCFSMHRVKNESRISSCALFVQSINSRSATSDTAVRQALGIRLERQVIILDVVEGDG
jgi:hypothetical protein